MVTGQFIASCIQSYVQLRDLVLTAGFTSRLHHNIHKYPNELSQRIYVLVNFITIFRYMGLVEVILYCDTKP